jgi:hypothetical protein
MKSWMMIPKLSKGGLKICQNEPSKYPQYTAICIFYVNSLVKIDRENRIVLVYRSGNKGAPAYDRDPLIKSGTSQCDNISIKTSSNQYHAIVNADQGYEQSIDGDL